MFLTLERQQTMMTTLVVRKRVGRILAIRSLFQCLIAVALLVGTATNLHAHLSLRASSPAAGESLAVVPDGIRLAFSEGVELSLSSIVLVGPDGAPVPLGTLEAVDERRVLAVDITGMLAAGEYTIQWTAVGSDGHPVRGEIGFTIEEDAEGLPVPVEEGLGLTGEEATPIETEPAPVPPPAPQISSFGAQSPLYAGVRWINYLGILGALGALGFALVLSSPRLTVLSGAFREAALRGAAGVGALSTVVLAASLPLRLQAQSHAIFGQGIGGDRVSRLLDTTWGTAWTWQAVGALLALIGFVGARRGARWGWILVGVAAIALIVTPGLSGHAAAVASLTALAVASDAAHVLGVGLWLGTLLVVLAVGIPLARREREAGRALEGLVSAFSPLALIMGGLVVGTGVIASLFHLSAVSDLWSTGYGRVLAAKVALVGIVLIMGALNWRRIGPAVGQSGGDRALMRSATAELAITVVIIAVTAVLVAMPLPDEGDMAFSTTIETVETVVQQ